MSKDILYESINFSESRNFNTSRAVRADYIGKQHWHPFVEILVSIADGNEVQINDALFKMGINDIMTIYPGDLHSIRKVNGQSLWVIQFSENLLDILYELKGNIGLISQYSFWKYDPAGMNSERMVMQIKEFFKVADSEEAFCEVHMYALLLDFFRLLGERCIGIRKEDSKGAANGDFGKIKIIAEICQYISQNCVSPLTLDEIAKYAGLSKSYFSHLFKQYTNSTFVDYLTEERVKLAKTYFKGSEVSITNIAFESGFSSISSFNRAFKKITGLSPSAFRESMVSSVN